MLSHNKVCELEDFTHPDLAPHFADVFAHERGRFGDHFPRGREYRKYWEVAMAIRALKAGGVVTPTAEVLGVGAGNEPTVFYLTNHVRRVFATDLYLGTNWRESANPVMMVEPKRYWPAAWNPRRLVVQHMNALDLQYEDGSFDGLFSSSSLEHFGTSDDIRRSVREMARVLKPGGVASISTEFRLAGAGPGLPNVLMFDERQVREWIIGGADWEPVSPPVFTVSEATRKAELDFARASKELRKHVKKHGEILFHHLTWETYPHVVLRRKEYVWTSVHLALRKR
jgi:SAM-dependent methyltransferase